MKGENPIYKGFLTTDDKDPKKRENVGNLALWENKSENPKAPTYTGTLQTEKRSYRIVLWKSEPKKEEGL
jgi:hypothetical protein